MLYAWLPVLSVWPATWITVLLYSTSVCATWFSTASNCGFSFALSNANVTFAFDSAKLNPQFDAVLNQVAQTLVEYNKTVIQVAGHTDSTGSHAYNMKLSEQRAASVKAYLESQGVPAARMVTIGAGPDYPIASNDTEAGRAQNRRVEITIVPVTQESLDQAKKKG